MSARYPCYFPWPKQVRKRIPAFRDVEARRGIRSDTELMLAPRILRKRLPDLE